eukprot:SAG31_NODE_4369_length_3305_cov_2.653774_2_plen_56_part_00
MGRAAASLDGRTDVARTYYETGLSLATEAGHTEGVEMLTTFMGMLSNVNEQHDDL